MIWDVLLRIEAGLSRKVGKLEKKIVIISSLKSQQFWRKGKLKDYVCAVCVFSMNYWSETRHEVYGVTWYYYRPHKKMEKKMNFHEGA